MLIFRKIISTLFMIPSLILLIAALWIRFGIIAGNEMLGEFAADIHRVRGIKYVRTYW